MHPRRLPGLPALLSFALLACGGREAPTSSAREPVPSVRAEAASAPPRARVLVAVVLDQLGSDTLERLLPHLAADGAIRRIAARGAYHHAVEYGYAGTYTAAGHASIHTGTTPSIHGVMANEVWSHARGEIASVDDGVHAVFGRDDWNASPSLLRVDTVADALRAAHPEARIVALSLKDRGSVIPGGRHPDAAVFYDKENARFTTSRYYGDAPPEWLVAFEAEDPVSGHLGAWTPERPELYEQLFGPDLTDGEGKWEGFGAAFPHEPARSPRPGSAFRATPASTEYLLELAWAAVDAYEIGRDDVPDFLSLSISGTDYVGHTFGTSSWEYLDNLVRVDRALGAFLERLERERGPIAVLLTSDHGSVALPEILEAQGVSAGRLVPARVLEAAQRSVERAVGRGEHVEAFIQPFITLSERALAEDRRDRVVEAVLAGLRVEGIHSAHDVRKREELARSEDPIERLVAASLGESPPGHVFVVPAEHWFVDDETPVDEGTSHGTPWPYDRRVPVLFVGPGVAVLESTAPLPAAHVARTMAALLGIDGPEAAPRDPLPGIRTRAL